MRQTRNETAATGRDATAGRPRKRFAAEQAGTILLTTALVMPVMIGMVGLGIDVSLWYMHKRIVQSVADSSALAAATVLARGGGEQEAKDMADQDAMRNDFIQDADNLLTKNLPPANGPKAGVSGFAEVIAARTARYYFSSLFVSDPFPILARSVGGAVASGEHCVLGLDPTMDGAVEFSGTADADISCGVASNSNSSKSIMISGNATLTADPAQAHGDIYVDGNAELITAHPARSFAPPVIDPYGPDGRNLQVPPDSPCDVTGLLSINGTATLDPGRYCGGIKITNGNVTFNPGVYIIEEGDFNVSGTSTLTGTDVTFIFTADNPADTGGLKLTGGTTANLSAPGPSGQPGYGGDYAGILFFQDPAAPSLQGANLIENDVLGGSSTNLQGAIYFPQQEIAYSGGSSVAPGCVQLIARKVSFQGNGVILNSEEACADQGVDQIVQYLVKLTE